MITALALAAALQTTPPTLATALVCGTVSKVVWGDTQVTVDLDALRSTRAGTIGNRPAPRGHWVLTEEAANMARAKLDPDNFKPGTVTSARVYWDDSRPCGQACQGLGRGFETMTGVGILNGSDGANPNGPTLPPRPMRMSDCDGV
jgi:hypothetical protein